MSRQLDRQQERQRKKLESWIKSLPKDKLQVINTMINNTVDKKVWSLNQAMETSIAAALFDLHDFSIKEVEEILKVANSYIEDSQEFLMKYGEDWIVELKKIEPKIKKRIKELLDKKVVKSKGIATLKKEFKDIPAKDLGNLWIEVKEEYGIKVDTTSLINKTKVDKLKTDLKAIEEDKKVSKVNTPKDEPKNTTECVAVVKNDTKAESKPTLKIVSKEIKIEGEFGKYLINDEGVKIGEEKFSSLIDVEAYEKAEIEKFARQMCELKEVFKYA